jgi:hypothetical protein
MATRIATAFSGTRALTRIAWRDPENIAERLTLYASQRLAAPSREWAEGVRGKRPDTPLATLAEGVRTQSAHVARIDGAVAGTPFFIALAPGYLSYLWQEARMGLRIAALYGRDPSALRKAGELLALRGMYPTPQAAEQALVLVRDAPPPEKPTERRPLRMWIRSVYRLLVFGGFMSAPKENTAQFEDGEDPDQPEPRRFGRLRAAAAFAVGAVIWLSTWVLPVTFMIAMAWACETHTRQLGRRALLLYDGEAPTTQAAIAAADQRQDRGHDKRQVVRTVALALSVAIPIGFVAYADHIRQSTGINWLGAVGALVALSLVLATIVVANRR